MNIQNHTILIPFPSIIKKKQYNRQTLTSFSVMFCLLSIQFIQIDNISFFSIPFLCFIISILIFDLFIRQIKLFISPGYLMIYIIWLVFFISFFLSTNKILSFQFLSYFSLFSIMLIFLSSDTSWHKSFISLGLLFWSAHAIVTILSLFFKLIYFGSIILLFSEDNANIMLFQYNNNTFPGLAGQTGTNAFFLSIGIGIIIAHSLKDKIFKLDIKGSLLLCILIFALFLTGKRGMLIANILAIIFLYISKNKIFGIKKFIYTIILFLFILVSIIILKEYIPSLNNTINRFYSSNDITSGRFDLYRDAISLIKNGNFFGYGIHTYTAINIPGYETSMGAHNDFLQYIVEIGYLGCILFFIPVFSIFIYTIRFVKKLFSMDYSANVCQLRISTLSSLYVQVIILFYSLIGNPFSYYFTLFIYILFCSIPIGAKHALRRQFIYAK